MPLDESLPARCLLVTESPVEGAALAAGFLDVQLVTPDELDEALRAERHELVAISAVNAESTLSAVVRSVTTHAPDDVVVLVEASDRSGLPALHRDPAALEGLTLAGVRVVGGLPCLVMGKGDDVDAPDLSLLVDYLAAVVAAREGAGAHVMTGELGEAEHELGEPVSRDQASADDAVLGDSDEKGWRSLAARLRRTALLGGAVVLILLVSLGVALLVAGLDEPQDAAAACTGLLVPVLVGLVYVIRAQRRFGRGQRRHSKDLKRGVAELEKRMELHGEALERQAEGLEALARKVEVVEVSVVDAARSVALLAQEARR